MRINLLEDEIDGEVQDGSVDLEQELSNTMDKVARWTMFNTDKVMNDEAIAGGAYYHCRADCGWKVETKDLRLEFKANLNPEEKDFILTTTMAVDFYKEYLRVLHDEFPELFAYPKNVLQTWRVKVDDIDLYTGDSLVAVDSYMSAEFTNSYKTPVDLHTFLFNEEYMSRKLTLPFAPKFTEDFRAEYLKLRKKLKMIMNRAMTGTFKGKSYRLDPTSTSINIYISKRTYTVEDGVIHPKFQGSISVGGSKVFLEDKEYSLYSGFSWRENASIEILKYFKELSDYLEDFFKSFNVEFKILMDKVPEETPENPEQ